jgi:hypothetical protein
MVLYCTYGVNGEGSAGFIFCMNAYGSGNEHACGVVLGKGS